MRRPTTPPTPDTAAQVRCALDMLRTAVTATPDIDTLVDAANDWGDDVAHSDATDDDKARCNALAFVAGTMFRQLGAMDAGNACLVIAAGGTQSVFEWNADGTEDPTPEFDATVEHAVRTALGKAVHA